MKIGIFYKVENQFLTDTVPIDVTAETHGEIAQHGSHYVFYKCFTPTTILESLFKSKDFDFYPRGRVVYYPASNSFCLYVDPCLTQDDLRRVIELFEITSTEIETATNEHYFCSNCY